MIQFFPYLYFAHAIPLSTKILFIFDVILKSYIVQAFLNLSDQRWAFCPLNPSLVFSHSLLALLQFSLSLESFQWFITTFCKATNFISAEAVFPSAILWIHYRLNKCIQWIHWMIPLWIWSPNRIKKRGPDCSLFSVNPKVSRVFV
jgi:hypothetical protein